MMTDNESRPKPHMKSHSSSAEKCQKDFDSGKLTVLKRPSWFPVGKTKNHSHFSNQGGKHYQNGGIFLNSLSDL